MRVLFCDKGIMYRGLVSDHLRKEGYEVVAVSGGQDVLDHLDDSPPGTFQVVVINSDCYQLSGIDVLRFIRKWYLFETLPVLLYSAEMSDKELVEELDGRFFRLGDVAQIFEALQKLEKTGSV